MVTFLMLFHMIGIAQASTSLEITWQIMQNIVLTAVSLKCFHGTLAVVLFDIWLASSPKNSSEVLFLSQDEFSIANDELANGQGQPCYYSVPKLRYRPI